MLNNLSLWLQSMRLLSQGELFFFGKTELGEINCYTNENGRTCILIPTNGFHETDLTHNLLEPKCITHPMLGPVLEISWSKRDDDEIALLFFNDLISTDSFSAEPVLTLAKKLLVWKDFLVPGGISRLNELIGLWGELYVTVNWPILSPYWIGPASSDIDFKSEEIVFDVKTTRSKHGPEIKISTEHQLDWPNKRIFICRIRVEDGTATDLSLHDLLNMLQREILLHSTLTTLDKKVSSIDGELLDLKFSCRDIDFFELSNNPSVITKTTLSSCIGRDAVNRISGLTYNLSLSGFDSIKPEEFLTLFQSKP
jgi:hypothetical protein